jgi:hypothetical protein
MNAADSRISMTRLALAGGAIEGCAGKAQSGSGSCAARQGILGNLATVQKLENTLNQQVRRIRHRLLQRSRE